ncbi:MAG: TlpA family protein disulfide reductase [Chitinophagales bacterium]|nr:TlpA family protein disulfide reductase [Chitinophagales bacterium]
MKYLPFIIVFFLMGCLEPIQTFEKLPPGIWRGVLMLDRAPVIKYGDDRDIVKKFDIDSEVPFTFEVIYDNDTMFHLVIHNDTERIKVTDIKFNKDKATAKDTIRINFPVYDTQIRAIYEDGVMEGDWIVNYLDNYRIPFKAVHGKSDRFDWTNQSDLSTVEGRWQCTFGDSIPDKYPAIGVFKQQKDRVVGTFQTETGDYRFLEGKMLGDKLYLSSFDGAHVFLFTGKIEDNNYISGTFRSGSRYIESWEGVRDDKASLRSAFSLTQVLDKQLRFSFLSTEGKQVSLDDAAYKDKIKIVQIMGTWCPNCMDETLFLKEYLAAQQADDIAWISIGFERYRDTTKSLAILKNYKEKMNIDHPVLLGGYYSKAEASKQLPQISEISSYPTLIIADKNNQIIAIHTGFNGPATEDYEAFKSEFETLIHRARNNQ